MIQNVHILSKCTNPYIEFKIQILLSNQVLIVPEESVL